MNGTGLKTPEYAIARFKVGDIEYEFNADDEEQSNTWNVEFRASKGANRFGLTGTGNSQKVMSTVVDIMKDFIKHYGDKVKTIEFSAKEESRKVLYTKMIKRLIPNWKLSTLDNKHHADLEFILTNPTYRSHRPPQGRNVPKTAADLQGAGLS